jgi:hypothetical protein
MSARAKNYALFSPAETLEVALERGNAGHMPVGNDGGDDGEGHDLPDEPEEPVQPIHSQSQGAPRGGWVVTPPAEGLYAMLWATYRDGARTVQALAKRSGVSVRTAMTAVHKGWPENNWPALQERWKLFEKQADANRARELENDRRAAAEAGKTSATLWREYQRKWMPVAEMAPELVREFGNRLKQVMSAATS